MRKQFSYFLNITFIICSAVVLASCQPSTPVAELNNDIQDIRVQMVEPERNTSKVEQFPLPNCGGNEILAQSLGTFASISQSATVGAKATVTGGGEVQIPEAAKLKLEIQVELAYQRSLESANARVDSIEMSASPGTHVVYTILWEEQTFNSIVQYLKDDNVYEAPYIYRLSVPKIDTSYNVICPNQDGREESILPNADEADVDNNSPTQVTVPPQEANTSTSHEIQPIITDCSVTPLSHRNPIVGEPWVLPDGGWLVVNFWSNEPGVDQTEHKLLLAPDEPRRFLGGGSAWQWPDECEDVARNDFANNPLPKTSLAEIRAQNLVR